MSAREEILDRIRTALKDAPEVPVIPRGYRASSQLEEAELIELLVDRLIDYKAQVSVVDNAEVPARIADRPNRPRTRSIARSAWRRDAPSSSVASGGDVRKCG